MSVFRVSSRSRLRLRFFSLGAVLLVGLAALAMLVSERLREARRDREEMVALRVFDELEREASVFLEEEGQRKSYQSLQGTNPESWAPFVVGYFRRQHGKTEMVAADGTTTENRRRLAWALQKAGASLSTVDPEVRKLVREPRLDATKKSTNRRETLFSPSAPAPEQAEPKKRSSGSRIIQSLNRAQERRKVRKKPSTKAPESVQEEEDQFQDYSELF